MKISLPLALLPLLSVPSSSPAIEWRGSLEEALQAAQEQKRVIFLAVNMDGERANDRLAKDVYRDGAVVQLSARTLALVASTAEHAPEGRACPRFGSVTCREHQAVELAARRGILKPDPQGFVVAPQHVFLAPDGAVILSVPYEITAEELEWCLVAALRAVDPDSDAHFSRRARAPKRLIRGDVITGAGTEAAPITREEALDLIARLKRGTLDGPDRLLAIRRLATADEKEARDYVLSLLRAGPLGGARGGAGGGGRGGGGPGQGQGQGQGQDWRLLLLRWIGYASPPSYWEVCAEFLASGEQAVQEEAIVALEQLGAPESLGALQAQLRRERETTTICKLLRALGCAGRGDRNARSVLLRHATNERTPLLAVNALAALGSLDAHAEVQAALRTALMGGVEDLASAAAIGAAFSRDAQWLEPLRERLKAEPGVALRAALEAAVKVLEGGALDVLREPLEQVSGDTLARPRFFGLEPRRP